MTKPSTLIFQDKNGNKETYAASVIIKTRMRAKDVKRLYASLPKMIAGQLPDPHNLRPLFFALVARRLYELIYEAFVIKAAGGTDSLGNSWRGLKPKTVKKRLSRGFIARYPQSAKLLINRVTDRLLDSFLPGQLNGANYLPVREQRYLLQANQLVLGSEVPYATRAHKLRRLWPARMKPWIKEAVDTAFNSCALALARKIEG